MGAGGQIGAELTDFVLVLNTKEAVKTFSHFGNITLGTNVSSKFSQNQYNYCRLSILA